MAGPLECVRPRARLSPLVARASPRPGGERSEPENRGNPGNARHAPGVHDLHGTATAQRHLGKIVQNVVGMILIWFAPETKGRGLR